MSTSSRAKKYTDCYRSVWMGAQGTEKMKVL